LQRFLICLLYLTATWASRPGYLPALDGGVQILLSTTVQEEIAPTYFKWPLHLNLMGWK